MNHFQSSSQSVSRRTALWRRVAGIAVTLGPLLLAVPTAQAQSPELRLETTLSESLPLATAGIVVAQAAVPQPVPDNVEGATATAGAGATAAIQADTSPAGNAADVNPAAGAGNGSSQSVATINAAASGAGYSSAQQAAASPSAEAPAAADPVIMLGAGDAVTVQVYGRPEMNTTSYVADNGTVAVPLAGAVRVAGMSPAQAGEAVATALRQGQYLLNPQVTVTLAQFHSQQISVLGEVRTPGRYPVESRTSVIDLLAQAGGETENGADVIYILRPRPGGHAGTDRYSINLRSLRDSKAPVPSMTLRGGDEVYVPRADRFYIYGEVQAPNAYRLEPGMTVIQALSRSGGVTARGSAQRIVISRQTTDGGHITIDAKPFDPVMPDDVIRVKERIF